MFNISSKALKKSNCDL